MNFNNYVYYWRDIYYEEDHIHGIRGVLKTRINRCMFDTNWLVQIYKIAVIVNHDLETRNK